jgi:hypothetical protein
VILGGDTGSTIVAWTFAGQGSASQSSIANTLADRAQILHACQALSWPTDPNQSAQHLIRVAANTGEKLVLGSRHRDWNLTTGSGLKMAAPPAFMGTYPCGTLLETCIAC